MSFVETTNPMLSYFDLELRYSSIKASEMSSGEIASTMIANLESQGERDKAEQIKFAASEISKVVIITQETEDEPLGILDIFTAAQVREMSERIHEYLGCSVTEHIQRRKSPENYPIYVGKLATHFVTSDSSVTSSFGSFELRHTDPSSKARGPLERNSREYAANANETIIKRLNSFYQSGFNIELTGPTKEVEGSRISWERGIAESQFLVLDYVCDIMARTKSRPGQSAEQGYMTIGDIENNIQTLMLSKDSVRDRLGAINPLMVDVFDDYMDNLKYFTQSTFYRGRMDMPRFMKEPEAARRSIRRIEDFLMSASELGQSRADQADIPVLDI